MMEKKPLLTKKEISEYEGLINLQSTIVDMASKNEKKTGSTETLPNENIERSRTRSVDCGDLHC